MAEGDANSLAPRSRLKQVLRVTIEVLVLGYIAYFFSTQAGKLERVLSVGLAQAAWLIGLGLAANLVRSWELKYLVGKLGGRIPYWVSFSLTMGSTLLNYLPMNAGMLVKARVLKKHIGVSYAHFASLTTGHLLATIVAGAALGLVALVASWRAAGQTRWYVAAIFAAALLASMLAFHVPLSSVPAGPGRIRTAFRDFLHGLHHIRRQRAGLAILFCFANLRFLLMGCRFWICFAALGSEATFLGCVLVAVVTSFLMLVSITPASLGVREVLVGAIAAVTGLSFEVGILAAGLDRVFAMLVHITTGLTGLALLRATRRL